MERPAKRARTVVTADGDSIDPLAQLKIRVHDSPEHSHGEQVDKMDIVSTPRNHQSNNNILFELINMLEPGEQSFTIIKQLANKMAKK